jgi:hypothetical protein
MDKFFASSTGQAVLAFLRVFAATVVACWVDAGMPVRAFSLDQLAGWLELAVQAGAALVIANSLGPWEKRYGRSKTSSDITPA